MPKALVLIVVDPRIERKVIDEIRNIPGVTEAHYIYGPYDMYVKLACDTREGVHYLIMDKIRQIYGIKATVTCFIAE
ncbi:Lrp/AsnC ligand binding domain-containing protein [Candidatus Bathyarchaeota archaeon]|nr:Lrp/AsnC ligand binding domain-containing protein [Candidatus Bathyarchaeota archaeon]